LTYARLDRSFVRAIRASHLTQFQLANLGEYNAASQLSRQLNSKFAVTPLALKRLRLIAEVVGHAGELIEVKRRG
jgi:hypothetical protein